MKIISAALTVYIFILIASVTEAAKKKKEGKETKCSTCREIVTNFFKGMERTKKQNYGGGNTDWEESRLGDYANSEVRLVEIMDDVCVGASKECPQMLEEYEEIIEEFWFNKTYTRAETEFLTYLCINQALACCPNNTYGPDCKECTGGKDRPCKGNGKCDGEGTRGGTGKCRCNHGYSGKLCDGCMEGYFEGVKNDTHTECNVCDISCKTSCTGQGPTKCDECKDGYTHSAQTGCQDIDECSSNPCKEQEYCSNTQGSFYCLSCNVACKGCMGPGFSKCIRCNDGYLMKEAECLDIDECESDGKEDICQLEGQKCVNNAGSYKCICKSGYIKDGDGCKLKPKEEEEEEEEEEEDVSEKAPKPDKAPSEPLETVSPKVEL